MRGPNRELLSLIFDFHVSSLLDVRAIIPNPDIHGFSQEHTGNLNEALGEGSLDDFTITVAGMANLAQLSSFGSFGSGFIHGNIRFADETPDTNN